MSEYQHIIRRRFSDFVYEMIRNEKMEAIIRDDKAVKNGKIGKKNDRVRALAATFRNLPIAFTFTS